MATPHHCLTFMGNILTMTNGGPFGNISLLTMPTALKLKDPNRIEKLHFVDLEPAQKKSIAGTLF